MYKQFRRILINILIVTTSIGLIGCGQGFKSQALSSSQGLGGVIQPINDLADVKAQMDEAQKATDEAQLAMSEAEAAIASISDSNGNINVDVFSASGSSSSVTTQGVLAPIVNKFKTVFDTVFSKVQMVKQKFDMARAALATAMAKLDPSNPAHAALIAQIQTALAGIDNMEMQFRNAMQMLAGKLDIALAAIDKLVAAGCSFIPVPGLCAIAGIFVDMFILDDVKNLIYDFKAKLLAL